MKLDPTVMRTMNRQDYRVLTAVETGMKSHALVPSALISSIAALRHGGTHKILSSLLRDKLLSHDRSCGYDGYRLTNSGYDILALHNLKSRGAIVALGDRIGTGKESDVYLAVSPGDRQIVLKFHRLGRTSFRDVKKKRDYFMINSLSKSKRNGTTFTEQPNSWLFLSQISAKKEFAFMKALFQNSYPTPTPLLHNRHIVAMGLVRGMPLYQLHHKRMSSQQALSIFHQSISIATRLASNGLVHCDLNEFNLMVDLSGIQSLIDENSDQEHYVRHSGSSSVLSTKGALSAHGPLQKYRLADGTGEVVTETPPEPKEFLDNGEPKPIVTLIDFPQMVSVRHPNAKELYERDMACLKRFFLVKCKVDMDWDEYIPSWEQLIADILHTNHDNDYTEHDPNHDGDEDEIKQQQPQHADEEETDNRTIVTNASTCLASKKQLRLDEELRASGYSDSDAARDSQLYYYNDNHAHKAISTVLEHENDDEDANDNDEIIQPNHNYGQEDEHEPNHQEEKTQQSQDFYDGALSDHEQEEAHPLGTPPTHGPIHDNENTSTDLQHSKIYKIEGTVGLDLPSGIPKSIPQHCDDRSMVSASASAFTSVSQLTWAQAEERARERVRRHLDDQKKTKGRKNAFRCRNSNKTFVKGKRVFQDFGLE